MNIIKSLFGNNSQVPSQPTKNTPSILDSLGKQAMTPLLQSVNSHERKAVIRKTGEIALARGKNWKDVNWRQFAMMHTPSMIRETPLEGGSIETSINRWIYLFELYKRNETNFVPCNLTTDQINKVLEGLNELKDFHSQIPVNYSDTPLPGNGVETGADLIRKSLLAKLAQKKSAYVPFGYGAGASTVGHAIPCKFTQEKDSVLVHVMNLGDGSSSHPVVDHSTSQALVSYKYLPIRIPNSIFWGDPGKAAFCRLIRYLSDPPHSSCAPYSGDDIYDIFLSIGEVVPDLGPNPEIFKSVFQIAGNCGEMAVQNVIRDILIDQNGVKEVKPAFLNLYLGSLIQGYNSFLRNPKAEEYACKILKLAAEEFGIVFQGDKSLYTEEEKTTASAIVKRIVQEVKKDAHQLGNIVAQPQAIQNPLLMPNTYSVPEAFPALDLSEAVYVEKPPKPSGHQIHTQFELPSFNSKIFINELKGWIKTLDTLQAEETFPYLYDCIRVLPIPSWGEKDPWNEIPEAQIKEIIALFEILLQKGLKNSKVPLQGSLFIELFLAINSVYAIADKLARRCQETKLEGYASPFHIHHIAFQPNEFTSLPIGEENQRYTQIEKYFSKAQRQCRQKVIFPVRDELPVENFVRDAKHNLSRSQGAHHVHFLGQFLKKAFSSVDSYFTLWIDKNRTLLPVQIHSLYYFSFLSYILLSARWNTSFPDKLTFESGVDKKGRNALLVQSKQKKELFFQSFYQETEKNEVLRELEEERFLSMGVHLDREPFIPIFSPKLTKLTTNDSVCQRLSEEERAFYKMSEATYRDLLRITRKKNLRLGLALQWLNGNFYQLDHPGIQKIIDLCFLGPEGVQHRLKKEPQLLIQLRESIRKGLEYFRGNKHHASAILFLIRLGIGIESHAKAALKQVEIDTVLDFYEKHLMQLAHQNLKKEDLSLDLHFFLLAVNKQSLSPKILESLLILAFSNIGVTPPAKCKFPWLHEKIPFLVRCCARFIKEEFSNQDVRNNICNAIMKHKFKDEARDSDVWLGDYPTYHCDRFSINFLTCKVTHKEHGQLASLGTNLFQEHNCLELAKLHGTEFWEEDGSFVSLDKKFKVHFDQGKIQAKMELEIGGKKAWYFLYTFPIHLVDPQKLHFLNYYPILKYTHLIPVDKQPGDPDFIVYDQEKKSPHLRADFIGDQTYFTRLDEQGKSLPIKMINLSKITDKNHPLYKLALRYSQSEYVLCYCHTQTKEVVELYFYRNLALEFVKNGKGLESKQYPDYYLQTDINHPLLNNFESAFVLQNEDGAQKILLPGRKVQITSKNFSKEVSFLQNEGNSLGIRHCHVFDVNPLTKTLESKDPQSYIYLGYLFQHMRDYAKANFYLEKVRLNRKFYSEEISVINEMRDFKDYTPEAIAFKMKVLFCIIKNNNQMLEERFKKLELDNRDYSFYYWASSAYTDYLRTIQCENKENAPKRSLDQKEALMTIPKDLRLSRDEEKEVLTLIKDYYDLMEEKQRNTVNKDKQLKIPDLIKTRYDLFFSPTMAIEIDISPKEFSVRPSIFSQLTAPNIVGVYAIVDDKEAPFWDTVKDTTKNKDDLVLHPHAIRIPSPALEAHFIELFEQARKSPPTPCAFDLVLQAALNTSDQGKGRPLATLLFYARHIPFLFNDLYFNPGMDDPAKIKIYNEIVKRVTNIKALPYYKSNFQPFLKAKTTFPFTKTIPLHLARDPKPYPPAPAPLPNFEVKVIAPYRSECELLFKKDEEKHKVPSDPPFLHKGAKVKGKIKERLIKKFIDGYEELKKTTVSTYTFKGENILKAKGSLDKKKSELQTDIDKKNKGILTLANASYRMHNGKLTPQELSAEIDFHFAKSTRQILKLTPEIIMKEVVLTNDLTFLEKNCPLLKKEEMVRLVDDVKDYYHLLVLSKMNAEALELIEKIAKNPANIQLKNDLSELLDYEFLYDPKEYPEISYFKIMEGKLPRPDQFINYRWVCEGIAKRENRMFQLPAGRGKTSYLIPLLILRMKREKLTPVVMTTPAMYAVEKDNLSEILYKLNEKLSFLEVGMHMKLTTDQVKFIYHQLRLCQKEGRAVLITPQIYASLKLLRDHARIKENNPEKAQWFGLVLDFFKTQCFLIGDESHRNFDSLIRAIFGVGDLHAIPLEERKLFMKLMLPLLGIKDILCENGMAISDVARMKTNLQGKPSDKDIVLIQNALAKHLSKSSLFGIPADDQEQFVAYWTNPGSPQPALLKKWGEGKENKQLADLSSLAGYFLIDLLPEIVKLRTEFDHGPSIYPEEEFDTPWHQRTPSTAQFKDPYRALSLSVKGTFHRKLNETQVVRMVQTLVSIDWEEQGRTFTENETQSSLRFKGWLEKTELSELHLRDVSLSDSDQMKKLHAILSKHPEALEYYLLQCIMPQIGYCVEQLKTTPADTLYGFYLSTIFSATPLIPEACPRAIHSVKNEACFESHVATEFCKQKNQRKVFTSDAEKFFEILKEGSNTDYKDVKVFCDPGGFFCDYPNHTVAEKWLLASNLDGVFYFKQGQSLQVDREEKICLVLRNGKMIECKGSDIKQSLKEHGLNWDKLDLGTLYDSGHTESANIPQKDKIDAFIFGGDLLTISKLIQAIMRLRGFLDEKKMQSLLWVFQSKLGEKIFQNREAADGACIFDWSLNNEVEELRKRVILTAFQEIAFKVAKISDEEIESLKKDPLRQLQIVEKFTKGILEFIEHDPYRFFGEHEKGVKTELVLEAFAKQQYAMYGYSVPYESNEDLTKHVNKVISETRKLVKNISTNFTRTIGEQVEQHCKMKKDTEQSEYRPRPFDPISSAGDYGKVSIRMPGYIDSIDKRLSSKIFNTKFLSDKFYMEPNQFKTANNAGVPLEADYLKPVDYFVIVIDSNEANADPEFNAQLFGNAQKRSIALAMSNEILTGTLNKIEKGAKPNLSVTHKVLVVTAEGALYQRGSGTLEPSEEDVRKIMNSQWMKDLVIDAALLRGQIIFPDILAKRIEHNGGWNEFEEFWNRICKSLPNPETANQHAFNGLKANFDKKLVINPI